MSGPGRQIGAAPIKDTGDTPFGEYLDAYVSHTQHYASPHNADITDTISVTGVSVS